jgi:uncharacterized protein
MARHTGFAHLPLHPGRAPAWLFSRMTRLAREIACHIVADQGPSELLRRLSDPFWFQAFGCVLGFDWHSSGVTTTVTGALKEGLKGIEHELGVFAQGGKGATSRKTPSEIIARCDTLSIDPQPLVYASRMAAKVDSAAVQDGYQLYHHTFFFTAARDWCVVQQGMSDATGTARRYHWLSTSVDSFIDEPHEAICSDERVETLNLVATEHASIRSAAVELARDPDTVMNVVRRHVHGGPPARLRRFGEATPLLPFDPPSRDSRFGGTESTSGESRFGGTESASRESRFGATESASRESRFGATESASRESRFGGTESASREAGAAMLDMPARHALLLQDVDPRHLHTVLLSTYERAPDNFESLLGLEGVGARTLRALALVSEVIYGTPASTRDPARFAFAHGGKDGTPFPVDRATYDRTVDTLHRAMARARVDRSEKMDALKRLSRFARGTEPA